MIYLFFIADSCAVSITQSNNLLSGTTFDNKTFFFYFCSFRLLLYYYTPYNVISKISVISSEDGRTNSLYSRYKKSRDLSNVINVIHC